MERQSYFLMQCGTCGRLLQVKNHLVGEWISCGHCQAQMVAHDDFAGKEMQNGRAGVSIGERRDSPAETLLSRAENLLREAR